MLSGQGTKKSFKLNSEGQIPAVGFGTWKSEPEDAYSSVIAALKAGYRHIDTAFNYGNEGDVGRAIRDSGIPRQDIFLTTKLWSTYHTRVAENLHLSLERLGVDYLDLWLMHWPVAMNPDGNPPMFPLLEDGTRDLQRDRHFAVTWRDMEALKDSGKIRAIGVANFDVHNLEVLREECTVVPAVNQVELHPYLQQIKLKEYCHAQGIHVTAYSPIGNGSADLLNEACLADIAKAHSCDAGAVMLAWGLQAGHSVIPKSVKERRIQSNLDAASLSLSTDEMRSIATLDKGHRYCNPPWGVPVFHGE